MGLPRFQGRGQRQAREASGLGLFDDGVPGSRFQTKMRPQLAVEQVEMIEGEPGKPAIHVLDDRGRPFLADAQHDLRVLGELGPFGGGQQIRAGFAGGDGPREYQSDAQQHERAEVFHPFACF